MSRCEEMTGVPSSYEAGWTLWGDSSYALESSLSPREVWYELHAAGLCDIQGRPNVGQPQLQPLSPVRSVPGEAPGEVSTSLATVATRVHHDQSATVHQDEGLPLGIVLFAALAIVVGVAMVRDKMSRHSFWVNLKTETGKEK